MAINDPGTVKEASGSSDGKQWQKAITEELKFTANNGSWTKTALHPGRTR